MSDAVPYNGPISFRISTAIFGGLTHTVYLHITYCKVGIDLVVYNILDILCYMSE